MLLSFKKITVVCLGIFLGGLVYGIHATIYNYNCIVPERKQLDVIKIDPDRNKYVFMGEEIDVLLSFSGEYLSIFAENARQLIINGYLEFKDYFKELT